MDSNDLLEQVLEKLRIILQDADEIDTYIINNKKVDLKLTEIKNNVTDIEEIFKQIRF